MEYLISIKATYYLCYGSYYSQSQLTTMYPAIRKLFVLKTQHDPDRLFTNVWYEKYRGGIYAKSADGYSEQRAIRDL